MGAVERQLVLEQQRTNVLLEALLRSTGGEVPPLPADGRTGEDVAAKGEQSRQFATAEAAAQQQAADENRKAASQANAEAQKLRADAERELAEAEQALEQAKQKNAEAKAAAEAAGDAGKGDGGSGEGSEKSDK